jgi:hypothetical protein
MRPLVCLFLCAALGLWLAWPVAGRSADGDLPPLQQTFQDIHLLQQLNRLRLSTVQLQELAKSRREVETERRKLESRHDTPEIRAAAAAIRQALLENRPPDELGPLFEKLEMLRAARGGEEGEPDQRLTRAAQDQARRLIGTLRADQIVRLVGEEDEDSLARQLLREAREVRQAPEPERKSYSSRTAQRLSLELTRDVANAGRARQELEAFLTRLLELPEADTEARAGALAAELGQIVNRAVGSPLGEIQWRAERRLAGLLMHPRLAALLEERLRLEMNRK